MGQSTISCVVDRSPKFYMQAWNWLVTLKAWCDFNSHCVIVHHVGPPPLYFREMVQYFGVSLKVIEPFGEGPAVYCNKLQQLEPLLQIKAAHHILCDADLVFAACPTALLDENRCRAKIVDLPSPPAEMLRALLDRAGFSGVPLEASPSFSPDSQTHMLNCNGGLYILPHQHMQRLLLHWHEWARWCLENQDLLQDCAVHADQLGFLLAMLRLDLPFNPLPDSSNFPVHFKPVRYQEVNPAPITAMHYHHKMAPDGQIMTTGVPFIDAQLAPINSLLATHHENGHYEKVNAHYQRSLLETTQ